MSRLINADRLYEVIKNSWDTSDAEDFEKSVFIALATAPTIEERKKGKWIPQDFNKSYGMITTAVYYYPKCSVCGWSANNTNFCPNCGADMRGEQE